jgi:hypothetical protein
VSTYDAGLAKPLTAEEVAALQGEAAPATLPANFGPPKGPGQVRSSAPADPDPVDLRPIDEIAVDRDAAISRVTELTSQRMTVTVGISELEGSIEAKLAEGVPGTTLAARRRLNDARLEERELADLIERAQARVDVLGRAWRHARNLERAEELRSEIAALVKRAGESDAAIGRAVLNLLDLLEGRYGLVQEAKLAGEAVMHANAEDPGTFGGILIIPTSNGQPMYAALPPEIAFDAARIPALKSGARVRRYQIGL